MSGSEIDEGNAQAYRSDPAVRSQLSEYNDAMSLGKEAYSQGDIETGWAAHERADALKQDLYRRDYIVRDD